MARQMVAICQRFSTLYRVDAIEADTMARQMVAICQRFSTLYRVDAIEAPLCPFR